METVLSFRGVSKRYQSGDFWKPLRAQALKRVDLELQQGEIFGLIGLNGAGKTTLMKAAVGLIRPDEGEVRIFGRPPQDSVARRRFGYLPELPYFPKYLSAWEVLCFYGRLFGLKGAKLDQRCRQILEDLGLGRVMREPIHRYSKGMQQRVGLAQTLLHDPELVFLDEPMTGLDPLGMKLMRDVILDLRKKGKTVFFNSHVLADVERICDRVGFLAHGEMRQVSPVSELSGGFGVNLEAELLRLSSLELGRG